MMRSLYSAVSGLKGHQTRMDVVGNNISNVNTTGFKSSRVTFADTLLQTQSGAAAPSGNLGGTNPKQIGLGVGVASIDTIFTDGSVQATGKNTDLCLSGNGLFVVKKGSETFYTRDGAFEFDAEGNYVLPGSGLKVQGWMASNGELNTSGEVTDIVIPSGKSMPPTATTTAVYTNNLKADTAVVTKVNGCNETSWTCSANMPCKLVLSNGTTVDGTEGITYTPDYVYSSVKNTYTTLGDMVTVNKYHTPVTVTLADGTTRTFTNKSTDTDWQYGYTTKKAGDEATATANVTVSLKNTTTGRTANGESGKTYKVGDTATTSISSGTVTCNANEKLVLLLSDGTKHDVSTQVGSYVVNSDKYTYDGHSATIVGAEVSFTVDEMTVVSAEGEGASLRVGSAAITDGYALRQITDGSSVTASATSPVTLTLEDGTTITGLTDGKTYKVGDGYEGTKVTTGNVTAGKVRIYLEDGTTHDDTVPTGTTYKVGDTYTYTNSGGTVVSTKIAGYAPLAPIKAISVQSQITGIEESSNTLVNEIIPGRVTASKTNALTLTLSDGTTQTVNSGIYDIGHSLPITTIINVVDSSGKTHSVPIYFTKTATGSGETSNDGNQWTVSVDGKDITGTNNSITEDDGSITTVDMEPYVMQFSTTGGLINGSGNLEFTLRDGANRSQTVSIDVSQLTQYVGNNTFKGTTDGNAAGTLSSVSIDSSGIITGTYTNSVKQVEAQVAVAQFNNAAGLTKTGNSLYQTSNNSGTANVKTASDLGCTITPSALEMSNVDIANEFSDMIVTQRGFQSNSKIITVSDEMLETMINMKR